MGTDNLVLNDMKGWAVTDTFTSLTTTFADSVSAVKSKIWIEEESAPPWILATPEEEEDEYAWA